MSRHIRMTLWFLFIIHEVIKNSCFYQNLSMKFCFKKQFNKLSYLSVLFKTNQHLIIFLLESHTHISTSQNVESKSKQWKRKTVKTWTGKTNSRLWMFSLSLCARRTAKTSSAKTSTAKHSTLKISTKL